MEQHCADLEQSGLSRKAYCKQAGVSYHALSYWIDKFRSESEPKAGAEFSEVLLPSSGSCPAAVIEIEYPDGVKLRFSAQMPASYIKALL